MILAKPISRSTATDGVDDHHRPEAAAVLAASPGFSGKAAGFGGNFQRVLGNAGRTIFIGVEAREMGADDFVGGVSLDPLGSRVPAHHVTLRVEHVDGVVDHALDEQLIRVDRKVLGIDHISARQNVAEKFQHRSLADSTFLARRNCRQGAVFVGYITF